MIEEDYTWGEDEDKIMRSVWAHTSWFKECRVSIEWADKKRLQGLQDLGYKNITPDNYDTHTKMPFIIEAIEEAQEFVRRYKELGEDRERIGQREDGTPTYMSGHLRYGVFASLNNFRVMIGHRLGMKEVFDLPKW